MANEGTAEAALNIVDYNLNIYEIREGQVKSYIYDDYGPYSGSWIRQNNIVTISGGVTIFTSNLQILVEISGDTVRVTSLSGTEPIPVQASGTIKVVSLSGTEPIPVQASGTIKVVSLSGTEPIQAQVSGTVKVVNLSGTEPIAVREYTEVSTYIATGTSALNMNYFVKTTLERLESVYIHLTSAPTLSSEIYINITPGVVSGTAAYITKCLSENPYVDNAQNYLYIPDTPLALESGDYVTLYYSNPCGASGLAYGVRMIFDQERP